MSIFNAANVDNRLREFVRGRVIVATTSLIVEFLESNQRHSYPLYSVDSIPDGHMLVFCVEVDGYLTFDNASEYRITPEGRPFHQFYFDPTAFALVKAADPVKPFVYRIAGVSTLASGPNGEYPIRIDGDNNVAFFSVGITLPPGNGPTTIVAQFTTVNPLPIGQFDALAARFFRVGSAYDLDRSSYTAGGIIEYKAGNNL